MPRRDFTGNGVSDLVWHTLDGLYVIWDYSAFGVTAIFPPNVTDLSYFTVGTGDFDGNGSTDIGWEYYSQVSPSRYVDGVGSWRFASGSPFAFQPLTVSGGGSDFAFSGQPAGFNFSVVAADGADFNGDRRSDFLLLHDDRPRLSICATDTAGRLAARADLDFDGSYTPVGVADLNGDGTTDILWRQTANGELGVWSMRDAAPYAWHSFGLVPLDWVVRETADFNGDGRADILWTNLHADGGLEVGTWTFVGAGDSYGAVWRDFGTYYGGWEPADVGDFTGDRSEDVFWRNVLTGENLYWDFDGGAPSRGVTAPTTTLDWLLGD